MIYCSQRNIDEMGGKPEEVTDYPNNQDASSISYDIVYNKNHLLVLFFMNMSIILVLTMDLTASALLSSIQITVKQ